LTVSEIERKYTVYEAMKDGEPYNGAFVLRGHGHGEVDGHRMTEVVPAEQLREAVKVAHTWRILHRTDWGHAHDSLLPENAPVPKGDEQFRVIEVVPAEQLREAVDDVSDLVNALADAVSRFRQLHNDDFGAQQAENILARFGGQ
jgi:hypothetical protein